MEYTLIFSNTNDTIENILEEVYADFIKTELDSNLYGDE